MRTLISMGLAALMLAPSAAAPTTIAGTWQGETRGGTSIVLDLLS